MLLYDFELMTPTEQADGASPVTHLRLSFDERFKLTPLRDSAGAPPKEFATLEEVRSHMRHEGLCCRYVFASECAYGMGFDEAFFKDLAQQL